MCGQTLVAFLSIDAATADDRDDNQDFNDDELDEEISTSLKVQNTTTTNLKNAVSSVSRSIGVVFFSHCGEQNCAFFRDWRLVAIFSNWGAVVRE